MIKSTHRIVLSALLFWLWSVAVSAAEPVSLHEFDNEVDRARYRLLVQELRCPKCQNQNLLDSNSEIAVDLRNQVARLVKEGRSDAEIKEYMVNRYGDFVLYRPPVQSNTLVLWWAPVIMLAAGALIFITIVVRRRKAEFGSESEADAAADNNE